MIFKLHLKFAFLKLRVNKYNSEAIGNHSLSKITEEFGKGVG